MKLSDFQRTLEEFRLYFGDCEVEFIKIFDDDDSEELEFVKVHDGYIPETVCEIRMTEIK